MMHGQRAVCWLVGIAIAMAGSAVLSQEPVKRLVAEEVPSVSACLVPLQPGDKDFGSFGGFRNNCDYMVEYSFCVQNPSKDSWSSTAPCQTGRATGTLDTVGPRGISAAHLYGGTRAHWFACGQIHSSGEGPAGIWGQVVFDGSVVRGKCRYDRYVVATPTAKQTNPATPTGQATPSAKLGVDAWLRGDYATAVAQWRITAAAGDPDSAYNLGIAYSTGKGVPVDQAQSDIWFDKAARQGHKLAATRSGMSLIRNGRYAEARVMLEKAVAGGDPKAQYLLGILLMNGNGGPVDRVRGRNLIAQAAAQGLQPAKVALANLDGTAPAQTGQVTPRGTSTAARTPGGSDPIWAACEGPIMAWLGAADPPDTSPSRIQQIREAWSYSKVDESWGMNSDGEIQTEISRHEQYIADAPRQILNLQIRNYTVIGTRAQICKLNAYMNARRTRR